MTATVKLKAGSLDIATGNLTPGSMAEAIDVALTAMVKLHPDEDPRGRRKLAVAIAAGVIGHLKSKQNAFVAVRTTSFGTFEYPCRIDVE
jgi:hypothetical protein